MQSYCQDQREQLIHKKIQYRKSKAKSRPHSEFIVHNHKSNKPQSNESVDENDENANFDSSDTPTDPLSSWFKCSTSATPKTHVDWTLDIKRRRRRRRRRRRIN